MKPKRTTRFLRILAFSLPVLAGTVDLWASGGEKGEFSSAVIWQTIAFVLLIVLLSRFVKKPLASFLSGRQEEVQNAIKQSARKKEEAEALLSEWQRKVDSLNQEVKELHQRIRAEGEAEQKKIVSRAKEEGERIRQQAGVIAEQELIKARAALKREMVDLSVELAERLLKEAIKPQDQERLIEEYIGKVRELGDQPNGLQKVCPGFFADWPERREFRGTWAGNSINCRTCSRKTRSSAPCFSALPTRRPPGKKSPETLAQTLGLSKTTGDFHQPPDRPGTDGSFLRNRQVLPRPLRRSNESDPRHPRDPGRPAAGPGGRSQKAVGNPDGKRSHPVPRTRFLPDWGRLNQDRECDL